MRLTSFDDKTLQGILAEIKNAPKAEDNVCGYGGYWCLDGGWLPGEVVCTPNGNHVNYGGYTWSDCSAGFVDGVGVYNGSWCGEDHSQMGGGGGGDDFTPDTPDSSDYEIACDVARALGDAVKNNTVIWMQQIENTEAFKLVNATCVADAIAINFYDQAARIIKDTNFMNAMHKIGTYNAFLNDAVAIIAVCDGEVTTADAWGGIGALLGHGAVLSAEIPPLALTLGGLSLICTFVSCYESTHNNSVIFSY